MSLMYTIKQMNYEYEQYNDEQYKDIKGKEPEKFCDARYLIIEDYKEFNHEYIKESHKEWKTRAFTTDFVKEELKKENCEYKNCNEPIEYVYNNVKYKALFKNWRNSHYRPHIYLKEKCPKLYNEFIQNNFN